MKTDLLRASPRAAAERVLEAKKNQEASRPESQKQPVADC